ncbi:small ribosomal subunit Rsm22 family protein [Haloarcula onubensis]|uniref:Class I SAM-dependent methyltransferase n=1 Tax=Haloarcula onubensis TaxID=2950539 RepID=A0ABU2FR85_9EURY|nr:class I SAM-dependent methyltransferase [Halomicroarcula sp. S3CR25-11]MDS0283273.1 class I SAM-dependent methyltransferase [Halomicroarcula sp. S3CR25-11]
MNSETRQQIRENAQYLRSVRPIDPEEIFEYVEGQPHPAVVRQVLREEAVDLAVVEREDGTFVPAPEGPLAVTARGVERFPPEHERRVEQLLADAYGDGWAEGDSGDRLRERVRDIKERYLRQDHVEYDDLSAHGYAIYHLPDYYAVATYALADLAADGLLPSQLRVLDVGAGVGGPALALADLAAEGDALLDYHAVEPSAAADVLEALLEPADGSRDVTVHRETAEAFDLDAEVDAGGPFDLVLFSNVLNELDEPAAVLKRYLDVLAEDGTVLALEPADRNTATGLRETERAVADDGPATVYAPTVRLWPHQSPASESWSFEKKPDIEVPAMQKRLDDPAGGTREFVNVDVQYAYSVLRTDDRRAIDMTPDRSTHAPMADAESYVTDRVNLLAIKLSHDLSGEDANPLYLLGDGSQRTDHFAVVTDPSLLNDDLGTAGYGDLLSIRNALVLWNDDEKAYNVVVDGETTVDRAR